MLCIYAKNIGTAASTPKQERAFERHAAYAGIFQKVNGVWQLFKDLFLFYILDAEADSSHLVLAQADYLDVIA